MKCPSGVECYHCRSLNRVVVVRGKNRITSCGNCGHWQGYSRVSSLSWWELRRKVYDRFERRVIQRFYQRMLDA